MQTDLSRRGVLAGALTLGAAPLLPADASAEPASEPGRLGSTIFRHGVASGDPLARSVLLWSRVTPGDAAAPGSGVGPPVTVTWEVATDPDFARVVKRGSVRTTAAQDHTVKVDVGGLAPYTCYWYRFGALGSSSRVGRTQTAGDDGRLHALRLGFVSCSNWTGGYFAAYRHLARRGDLDAVLHLGDYIYEYGNGADRYGPASLAGQRDHVPATEILTLADYRARHGQYKTDRDLSAAHARFPWIVIFDDHEVANNTYNTGAENHTEGTEGSFVQRRRDAYQAYLEWMPIRLPSQQGAAGTRFWRRFTFGPLADLSVLETRQNRSQQASSGQDTAALADPARVLMEPEQMAWLKDGIANPAKKWHLLANQVVFTRVSVQPNVPGTTNPVFNVDQWDGYQDDQSEVTAAMAGSSSDTVILTGDIHSSWANEIPVDPGTYRATGDSAAVEFVCPSVTSDGFRETLGSDQAAMSATTELMTSNPNIKYLDGIGHGYAVLDVTPQRVQADFWHISDREDPMATQRLAASWRSSRGDRTVLAAPARIGPRSDLPTGSRP